MQAAPQSAPVTIQRETSTAASVTSNLTAEEVATLTEDHTHCLVCYSDLTFRGKTPCDHDDICGICHLRLRHLHGDNKCPICKASNDQIIVDRSFIQSEDASGVQIPNRKRFEEYPMWGNELGAGFVHRSDVGMFFPVDYYEEEVIPLFSFSCYQCDFDPINNAKNSNNYEDGSDNNDMGDGNNNNKAESSKKSNNKSHKSPLKALQEHLRVAHRKSMCSLCIDHKRDFVARLPRMTPKQVQNHLKKGDGPTSGFDGHPLCEFCRPKRFYDLTALHQHLHKDHYKCHICQDVLSLPNQFFKNYSSLEKHFDRQHFLCHDVQCLEARFVVFGSELDLRGHELSVHGGTSTGSTKINLEFRTRRTGYDGSGVDEERQQQSPSDSDFNYGLDGQAFVPQALPVANRTSIAAAGSNARNNSASLHPLHLQRTAELREQAALIRLQQQQEEGSHMETFPTLQAATESSSTGGPSSGSGPMRTGWTSGNNTLQRLKQSAKPAGQVTEEDFPSLASSSGSASSGGANAFPALPRGKKSNTNSAAHKQFAVMTSSASQQPASRHSASTNWGVAASSPTPAPSTAASNTFLAPSAGPTTKTYRQEDLAPDNFPALGGGSKRSSNINNHKASQSPYSAANALAKAYQQGGTGVTSTLADFPAITSNQSKKAPPAATTAAPPSLASTTDFPLPPSSQAPAYPTVRQRLLADSGNVAQAPSKQAMANMLQMPAADKQISPEEAQVAIEEMKGILGASKYKQLKRLTKDFAGDSISPEGYVDQVAALFDRGYGDADFWSFVPTLIGSCPKDDESDGHNRVDHAFSYMQSIRRQHLQEPTQQRYSKPAAQAPKKNNSNGGWGSGGKGAAARVMQAPPQTAKAVAQSKAAPRYQQAQHQHYSPSMATTLGGQPMIGRPGTKIQNAWGGGGPSSAVLVAQARPGSVAAAAANQGPQGGSATKFMAKETKKQQHQQQKQQVDANAGGKKKKKANKNELRSLAFGK